ncbi:MAG: hypothetical protein J6T51_02010 [Kiritimatiellae bacterium]|nr:hypothetical protein [Kiritimatiellia bacterium]
MKKTTIALAMLPCLVGAATLDRQSALEQRAQAAFTYTVEKARRHDRALGAAELFQAAFHFCETGRHLDQLDIIFDVAAEMQDRNPESRTFGNFRWSWRDGLVMDLNAVDFCMQTGSLVARDHLGKLSPAQREKFLAILDRAVAGCLAHRVRASYTNIAIINASNLILLGEALSRRDVFDEGVRRLDALALDIALFGVHEYSSTGYTAVDIDALHLLHAHVRDPGVRDRAERLLKFFWTDLCASVFAPAGRLAGPHSRDYDYLYGMGGAAALLRAVDVAAPLPGPPERPSLGLALSEWRPPASITSLASLAPRTVVAFWGEDDDKYRTTWIGRNVALGVAGANYWNMDIPLAIDLASPTRMARGYFIPDARRDPYGMKKIPEGNGPHQKTLHLRPFWCGVQRGRDALGLAVYRSGDVPPDAPTLESHFVFPSDVDEVVAGGVPVSPTRGRPFARPLASGDCVFARNGGGAFAVRVAWSRGIAGGDAPAAVVWDDTPGVNAFRLTVAHHDFWGRPMDATNPPAAALWVRVTDDASTAEKFAAFRAAFSSAVCSVKASATNISIKAAGEEGPVALCAAAPFDAPSFVEPAPKRAVFALNGRDIGKDILGEVPGLAEYRAERERMLKAIAENRIPVTTRRDAVWEAEKGAMEFSFRADDDPCASGGKFVWLPGEPGGRRSGRGAVSWQLDVHTAGTYHLWGRVMAPTPDDDSFFVSAYAGEYPRKNSRSGTIFRPTVWPTGVTKSQWQWRAFKTELTLPAGPVVLTLHSREDGTKIDRLLLTSDPSPCPVLQLP